MDRSNFEGNGIKKAMGADRLAELALIDPKRANRILANRQSAVRSKERKIRCTSKLERKVQTLQTEATTLSTQVTLLQRDTTGLTAENKELKLQLQALEQQAQLRDALNEALREEVQRLEKAAGQIPFTGQYHGIPASSLSLSLNLNLGIIPPTSRRRAITAVFYYQFADNESAASTKLHGFQP